MPSCTHCNSINVLKSGNFDIYSLKFNVYILRQANTMIIFNPISTDSKRTVEILLYFIEMKMIIQYFSVFSYSSMYTSV